MVGAAYAAGLPVDEIERLFTSVRIRDLFRPVWAKDGLLDNGPLARSVERMIGPMEMSQLRIPFAAMATDAETGEGVVLQSGRLSDALQASTAIPCLVRPVDQGGRRLIDGGVLHKVPVRLARSMGADLVIAVDLSLPLAWLGRVRNPVAVLMQVIEMMDQRLVRQELQEADMVIQPTVDCGSFQFRRAREQVESGEAAARRALPQLQERLAAWLGPVGVAAD